MLVISFSFPTCCREHRRSWEVREGLGLRDPSPRLLHEHLLLLPERGAPGGSRAHHQGSMSTEASAVVEQPQRLHFLQGAAVLLLLLVVVVVVVKVAAAAAAHDARGQEGGRGGDDVVAAAGGVAAAAISLKKKIKGFNRTITSNISAFLLALRRLMYST